MFFISGWIDFKKQYFQLFGFLRCLTLKKENSNAMIKSLDEADWNSNFYIVIFQI